MIINSLKVWLSNNPTSHHPSDEKRFYTFVKCVGRYGRGKNYRKIMIKTLAEKGFETDFIIQRTELFDILTDFNKTEI